MPNTPNRFAELGQTREAARGDGPAPKASRKWKLARKDDPIVRRVLELEAECHPYLTCRQMLVGIAKFDAGK